MSCETIRPESNSDTMPKVAEVSIADGGVAVTGCVDRYQQVVARLYLVNLLADVR
jgi:hypothetical protein